MDEPEQSEHLKKGATLAARQRISGVFGGSPREASAGRLADFCQAVIAAARNAGYPGIGLRSPDLAQDGR